MKLLIVDDSLVVHNAIERSVAHGRIQAILRRIDALRWELTMPSDDPIRTIHPGAVFELVRDLSTLSESLRLNNVEWGLLFAVTGKHTVYQIGAHFALSAAERDRAFSRLLAAGLIRERAVSYSEYLRAMATIRDDEPKTLGRFLRAGAAIAGRPGAIGPPPDAGQDDVNLTRAVPTVDSSGVKFEPLAAPVSSPLSVESGGRRLSLKALMRFILSRAPDTNSGQLDVYRVFIRVNTKLLKSNGITTLRFEDDHLVSDPELKSAILSSVRKTLGVTCPQEVFT